LTLSIVPFAQAFEPPLLAMWRAYQEFYQVADIDEERNRAFVQMILENPALGRIHLALADDAPVGFSTIYFTFASTRACKVALLNDLFVVPQHRRSGIGRALLEHALSFAREEGIGFVRWSTSASNTDAQRLYAAYGAPSSWQTYSVDLSKRPSS
jgi:GNAT superfamily N-acetyltransferase